MHWHHRNPPEPPVGDADVLAAERAVLRPPDGGGAEGSPLRALCISGGGIRSATFAWGALQRLAAQGLLDQFDYMSTVSGGGFIGSWLTGWIQRAKGLEAIRPQLAPNAAPPAAGPDADAHLRAYNNYLTPRMGATSPDTWTLAATIVRNVLLNWLVFLPLLLAALMAPRLWLAGVLAAPDRWLDRLALGACALLMIALWNIARYLPGLGGVNHTTRKFLGWVLAPLVAAMLLSALEANAGADLETTLAGVLAAAVLAWFGYGVSTIGRHDSSHRRRELLALFGAVVVLALALGLAAWLLQAPVIFSRLPRGATVGVPLLLAAFCLAGTLFVGLSSHVLGTQDREWLARAAAYISLVLWGWLLAFGAVLLAPSWINGHYWRHVGVWAVTAVSAWVTSHLGFTGPATPTETGGPGGPNPPGALQRWALKLAPALFIATLVVGLSVLTDWLLWATGTEPANWMHHADVVTVTSWQACLAWLAGFALLSWFMARYINVNKFSLQGMYRDRLIRAYLGASNPHADANHFTGFSPSDDIALQDLNPRLRPLHIVNMTLNLVAGERLAWQQRKAEPFTASALYCGSPGLGYRPSARYGGEGGMTLGTAVAISGAAASPNMGYHSSPIVGFIMTLFNVRLGAWLGNPGPAGKKSWTHAGPRSAARSMIREALGHTSDTSDFVYLSDGGHFENLGLYEMVRRRCQTIVVLDGGCDPDYTYEDLGNALRKIRIDQRVPIEFSDAAGGTLPSRHARYALARIGYSQADPACEDGLLIYIKPTLLGTEPPDIASYHDAHPAFPHQSTAEQWFDESQTESYRLLGVVTIGEMCGHFSGTTLEEWAEHLSAHPAVPATATTAT